jgi:hypothetical protein
MTEDEFLSWLPSLREGYAEEIVRNGGADASAARAKAERDTEQLFPDGRPSSEQLVFVIEAQGSRSVSYGCASERSISAASFGSMTFTYKNSIAVAVSGVRRWSGPNTRRGVEG